MVTFILSIFFCAVAIAAIILFYLCRHIDKTCVEKPFYYEEL